MNRSQWMNRLRKRAASRAAAPLALGTLAVLAACGPQAHIPLAPRPVEIGADTGTAATLARTLAPVLYQQRDETFPLSRAVAVVHPTERLIAYHLLWQDDVHGAWIPKTIPTDQEIVWVGYDSTYAPTDIWTYWHGKILHAPWKNRQVEIDVQWGKHGSLPRGINLEDLPRGQSMKSFFRFTRYGIADIWLSRLNREGPMGFFHSYARYLQFTKPLLLTNQLNAVVVAADPGPALQRVFGTPYSEKPWWPWGKTVLAPGKTSPISPVAHVATAGLGGT
jgi:hypothetical protein